MCLFIYLFIYLFRGVVITSIFDEDPYCVGEGGPKQLRARYHLSDEPNGQNVLA